MDVQLNGVSVSRREGTIFVALPREAWREIAGGCSCAFCEAVPGRKAYWDTLAVSQDPPARERSDTSWTVHRPEHNPDRLREGELDREGSRAARAA